MDEDLDFQELVRDILVSEEDEALVSAYLDAFLPRWSKRTQKKYPPADSFAAACGLLLNTYLSEVGARRLVLHLGLSTTSDAILSTERTLARAVSSGIIDCATLSESVNQYGIDKVALTDPFSDSIYVQHMKGRQREGALDGLSKLCLDRAEQWSPDVAQDSSRKRSKSKSRRDRYLSLYVDVEAAKQARTLNGQDIGPPRKNSEGSHNYPRKTSIDKKQDPGN